MMRAPSSSACVTSLSTSASAQRRSSCCGCVAARSTSVLNGAVRGSEWKVRTSGGFRVAWTMSPRRLRGPLRVTVTSTNGGIEGANFQSAAAVRWLSTAVGSGGDQRGAHPPAVGERGVADRVDATVEDDEPPVRTRWSIAAALSPSATSCRRSTTPS